MTTPKIGLDQPETRGPNEQGCGTKEGARRQPPRRRSRARYAKDDIAERAAVLSLKLGVKLILHADGSVEITGKLDSPPGDALASTAGDDPDDALARWEAKHGHTRHS